MDLKEQVTNLELSQKLEKLGVEQDSLFYWVKVWDLNQYKWELFQEDKEDNVNEHISAFTVAELLNRLPIGYYVSRWKNSYSCGTTNETFKNRPPVTKDKNPANAPAKMLIYLIENK